MIPPDSTKSTRLSAGVKGNLQVAGSSREVGAVLPTEAPSTPLPPSKVEHRGGASVRAGGSSTRQRRRNIWSVGSEKAIEAAIRVCGISAIIFVFAIFFFV